MCSLPDPPPKRLPDPRCHGRRECGATLIESLTVLAVIGVLLGTAVPGFARLVSGHRASTAVNDLVHGFSLARSEALRRGRRVYIAPVAGRWHDGWAVFVDRDDDRLFDPTVDERIAGHDALSASITISNPSNATREPFTDVGSPPRTYVMFDGNGYPRQRSGALGPGSVVVTDRTGGSTTVRTLCLASYGRVRVVVDRVGCS